MKKNIILVVFIAIATTTQAQSGIDLSNHFQQNKSNFLLFSLILALVILFSVAFICFYLQQKRLTEQVKKVIEYFSSKERRCTPDENNKIEARDCIDCKSVGTVKGKFNEEKKHAELICSSCGSIYHQYFPYGSFYLQPKTTTA